MIETLGNLRQLLVPFPIVDVDPLPSMALGVAVAQVQFLLLCCLPAAQPLRSPLQNLVIPSVEQYYLQHFGSRAARSMLATRAEEVEVPSAVMPF